MKRILLCLSTSLLNACQPLPSIALQQQNFICISLIEGYLKAQQLHHFELRSQQFEQVNSMQQITYLYAPPSISTSLLGFPKVTELHFQCQQRNRDDYSIQLLDRSNAQITPLLSLHLPRNQFRPSAHSTISNLE